MSPSQLVIIVPCASKVEGKISAGKALSAVEGEVLSPEFGLISMWSLLFSDSELIGLTVSLLEEIDVLRLWQEQVKKILQNSAVKNRSRTGSKICLKFNKNNFVLKLLADNREFNLGWNTMPSRSLRKERHKNQNRKLINSNCARHPYSVEINLHFMCCCFLVYCSSSKPLVDLRWQESSLIKWAVGCQNDAEYFDKCPVIPKTRKEFNDAVDLAGMDTAVAGHDEFKIAR
uniref:Uncharacterized protein n=1 Tax=Salix viminalis TaxID=40686 RepID=A0A6N2LPB5_SALVM